MGCCGSREMKNNRQQNGVGVYYSTLQPRYSYCNGRITRIIQDDLVDFCDNSDSDKDIDANYNKDIQLLKEDIKRIDVNGSWISGVCAGGSRNNVELFATNPQYEFGIHTTNFSADDIDTTKILVNVCLKQLHFKTRASHIGFFVYKNDNSGINLGAEHFLCMPPIHSTNGFKRTETISETFYLKPGVYVIIPAIFHAYHENEFIIYITVSKEVNISLCRLITPVEPEIFYR